MCAPPPTPCRPCRRRRRCRCRRWSLDPPRYSGSYSRPGLAAPRIRAPSHSLGLLAQSRRWSHRRRPPRLQGNRRAEVPTCSPDPSGSKRAPALTPAWLARSSASARLPFRPPGSVAVSVAARRCALSLRHSLLGRLPSRSSLPAPFPRVLSIHTPLPPPPPPPPPPRILSLPSARTLPLPSISFTSQSRRTSTAAAAAAF
ncbi:Hypothetical protein NTJ_02674 [Nesidiocoris tenuis]|uniref:Uncharacterized protein n=1 Tax=Nesidiocoris tenuis TaxID=355587 RepID=A0ABN7ACU9_9HEMI|nr:Hypothetical protein NTJ_02674 [Nesidiocoris tenuis]